MLLPVLLSALAQGALGGEHSYVVRGAALKCSQGTDPGILNAMYSHGVYIKGKAVMNVADAIPGANISQEYAFGFCKLLGGAPCKPQIAFGTKWSGGKEDVLIEGEYALLSNSTLPCACQSALSNLSQVGFVNDIRSYDPGVISIIDDGQHS
ncbi:DUF4280 domain-containing protein [Paenibacillus terreus]|uniref:DUF4280 domain-containing protein n=1 Tax=Paenibacillus terreus TaxID=1387834 RepID=A0ABV5B1F2_9BACL